MARKTPRSWFSQYRDAARRLAARRRQRQNRARAARSPKIEPLEARVVLSWTPLAPEVESSLAFHQVEWNNATYDPSRVLVRVAEGVDVASLLENDLAGATLGHSFKDGLHEVVLRECAAVDQVMATLDNLPGVLAAEKNHYLRLAAEIPDDPHFGSLWGLHNTGQSGGVADADIDAPEAWSYTTGSSATVVAVLDTGVDYSHPDLASNIWVNADEIPGNGQDDDGNGYVDDVRGWDFVNWDNDPADDHGHGTHVAGTIGAAGNNDLGVTGVAWTVQIMPLKFLDSSGSGTLSGALQALDYAVQNGAQISNHSYGGPGYSQAFFDGIAASRDAGHIVVAAAGNDGEDIDTTPHYPASYNLDNVVSVAATTRSDGRPSWSNYGATSVDLGAPGASIRSTVPGGYSYFSGTSMATPHVAGAMALLQSERPEWSYTRKIDTLKDNVDPIASLAGKVATGGRLNVARMIEASQPTFYYVDSVGGSDANSGMDTDQAWATLDKMESVVLEPGDQVFLKRGSVWADQLDLTRSGTESKPIVIDAYGTGSDPIIRDLWITGSHTVLQNFTVDRNQATSDAVSIRGANNVVLRNLEVRNGLRDGIDIDDAQDILIDNLYIHHFLAGSYTNQYDAHGIVATDTVGITIRDTEIHHVSGDAFQADPDRNTTISTNVLIEDSHFWTGPLAADFNDQWLAGQKPGENAVDTKVVKENWDAVPRMQLTLRNVTANGWGRPGTNTAAFFMKEKIEAVFDGVTMYDNEIGFRSRGARGNANITLKNAVIYDTDLFMRSEDDQANLTIYNSTFGEGISNFVQFAGGDGGKDTWVLQNNAFLNSKPSLAGDASNLVVSASDFVDSAANDYRPSTGSPLIDAGVTLDDVTIDRDGTSRPQGAAYDVGAYEAQPGNSDAINFNDYTIGSYGGDVKGTTSIEDDGATLHLTGNLWKQIEFPYTVTSNTVLEFDFRSSKEADVHAIGFDTDLNISKELAFTLYGTQVWGIRDFFDYSESAPNLKHYTIPVGEFYTGSFQYLFFANDHDVSSPDGESVFSNVRIYETGGGASEPPVVSLPGSAADYTENDPLAVIDAGATVSDSDSADFGGGTLTVQFASGGTPQDRLLIRNQGTGAGQIGVTGSNVTYGGTTIGSFSGGTNGSTELVVSLNANATIEATQALLRNVAYSNVSDDPSSTSRTVGFVLTDGDGGQSAPATQSVNVAPVNDAPEVSVNQGLTVSTGGKATIGQVQLEVTDVDGAPVSLVYTLITLPSVGTLLRNDVPVNANDTFTQADVNANLVTYQHGGGTDTADNFTFDVSDGRGGTTGGTTFQISIQDRPDAINFNDHTIGSYGGDVKGTTSIEDDGATLHLTGNVWKQIEFPYTVTSNTVLEFDFRSSKEADVHAIGFDTDLNISKELAFTLYGTQVWGIRDFFDYSESAPNLKHYTIPVGEFYTGSFQYLFFANDHDVSNPKGESLFSNVRIYEANAPS